MPKKPNSFSVEYTNKDVMDKLEKLHTDIQLIKEQTIKTNGRVTALEKNMSDACSRVDKVEEDNKNVNIKLAGAVAVSTIVVSIVVMIISKMI